MPASGALTLSKEERLCGRTLIEKLFGGGGSRSIAAFPLRLVYMKTERHEGEPAVRMMISVPKKHFKRAVKRNRVKRQVREAFRLNKSVLLTKLQERQDTALALAFIWLDDEQRASDEVESKVLNLLHRVAEKI